MFDEIKSKIGSLDVIVNNAGIAIDQLLEDKTSKEFNEVLNTNYPKYECDCSKKRVSNALRSISHDDLKSIIEEDHKAEIKCQFCNKTYNFTEEDLNAILNGKDNDDEENEN